MANEEETDQTAKGQRWPSNAELDLQRRLDEEKDETARQSALQGGAGQVSKSEAPYAVEDNDTSNYVGVSPEYQTYADDRQKPLRADGGAEEQAEDKALQATPVRGVSTKEDNQTQGGGTSHESVYTATSGEDFTPDKVKATGPDGGTVTGGGTPIKTAPPAKRAAPTRPSEGGSNS